MASIECPDSKVRWAKHLRQAEIAIFQHRDHTVRIDRRVCRLKVLAGEQIDDLELDVEPALCCK
jgi:hypothetical protein